MIDPPRVLLRRHGLVARKQWGQNFLVSENTLDQIVAASGAEPGRRVVEIGAGLGTLTARLLDAGADVWAIERDRDLCRVLRCELEGHPALTILEADAKAFDYSSSWSREPATIVGNLPYHLTGPLLYALLDHEARTGAWLLMVQKEVAQRLCAAPGSRTYGGVTVGLSRVRAIDTVCAVPRHCFMPAPRVDSAVVRFDPRPAPLGEVADEAAFLHLVRSAFQRRRKTLANALGALGDRATVLRWCAEADVDPGVRPEQLGPEAFAALQRAREQSNA